MALATQCPHCLTIFRVAGDQLKLRGGLVRCGSCREVFNGNEYLVEAGVSDGLYHPAPGSKARTQATDPATPPAPPSTPAWPPLPGSSTPPVPRPLAPPTTRPDAAIPDVTTRAPAPAVVPTPPPFPTREAAQETAPAVPAPAPIPVTPEPKVFRSPSSPGYIPDLGASTVTGDGFPLPAKPSAPPEPLAAHPVEPAEPAEVPALYAEPAPEAFALDGALDGAPADEVPHTVDRDHAAGGVTEPVLSDEGLHAIGTQADETDTAEEDAEPPGFVRHAERRARTDNVVQIILIILSALMIPVLLLQGTYYWRNQIAHAAPALRPMLNGMCASFHCTVGLPAEIDQLSLESDELQVVPPSQNIYALSLVIRNRDSDAQAWPAIELTLNNDDEKPVVRRVFRPRDYLADAAQVEAGLPGQNEQPVKLIFELDNALVSGYRVYLFHP